MSRFFKSFMIFLMAIPCGGLLFGQDYQDPQNMPVAPQHTDCQTLPESFPDVSKAIEMVKAARFHFYQEIKTTRRSGLMKASYSSCDFKQGYLLVTYDGKELLYPRVSRDLWEGFQATSDIDGYYIDHIKDLPLLTHE